MIDRPNPQPVRSNVPEYVGQLLVKLDKPTLSEKTNQALVKYRRAANYIAAAMIFLQDDVYVKRDIKFEDIKPRLLGHWGTCPGLTLVYSHLNILIRVEGGQSRTMRRNFPRSLLLDALVAFTLDASHCFMISATQKGIFYGYNEIFSSVQLRPRVAFGSLRN